MASGQQWQPLPAVVARRPATIPAGREVVPSDPRLSARWHMHSGPSPFTRWNYHPEYEVHLIRFGTGRYVVGDRIDVFSAGHLVLVGSNLPHHWISDLEPGEVVVDRDVVLQFHPDWIRQCQAVLPELSDLDPLLAKSARGIEFTGQTARTGAQELQSIGETAGAARLQHIFGLLDVLASAPSSEHQVLSKAWLPPLDEEHAADIVDRAFDYIIDNLVGEVRLSAVAALIGMSESAFSKYFKRVSGQTFSDTVRKLRLARAGKLLKDTERPVAAICHRAGYANLSNFNRQFRAQYGITPREFRRQSRL